MKKSKSYKIIAVVLIPLLYTALFLNNSTNFSISNVIDKVSLGINNGLDRLSNLSLFNFSDSDTTIDFDYSTNSNKEGEGNLFSIYDKLHAFTADLDPFNGTTVIGGMSGACSMKFVENSDGLELLKFNYRVSGTNSGVSIKVDETYHVFDLTINTTNSDVQVLDNYANYADKYIYGKVEGYKASIDDGPVSDGAGKGDVWFLVNQDDSSLDFVMANTSADWWHGGKVELSDNEFKDVCSILGINLDPKAQVSIQDNNPSSSSSAMYEIIDEDGYTNVRENPSSESEILFKLYENQKFTVLDDSDSWWEIQYEGQQGYVHSSRISPVYLYQLTRPTSIRGYPDSSSKSYKRIEEGDLVELINKTNNYWWEVDYKGLVGFVKSSCLERSNELLEDFTYLENSHYSDVLQVVAGNGLIIRSKPSKESEKIGKLEYGSLVEVLYETDKFLTLTDGSDMVTGKWVQIQSLDGLQTGYVFDGYLSNTASNAKNNWNTIKSQLDVGYTENASITQWLSTLDYLEINYDYSVFTKECRAYIEDATSNYWGYPGAVEDSELNSKWGNTYDLKYSNFGHPFETGNGGWEKCELTEIQYLGFQDGGRWYRLDLIGGYESSNYSEPLIKVVKIIEEAGQFKISNYLSFLDGFYDEDKSSEI